MGKKKSLEKSSFYLAKYISLYRKNADRRIVVTKTNTFSKKKIPKLKILPNTLEKTAQLLKNFPLTPAELEYVVPLTDQIAIQSMNGKQSFGFISTIGLKLQFFL